MQQLVDEVKAALGQTSHQAQEAHATAEGIAVQAERVAEDAKNTAYTAVQAGNIAVTAAMPGASAPFGFPPPDPNFSKLEQLRTDPVYRCQSWRQSALNRP